MFLAQNICSFYKHIFCDFNPLFSHLLKVLFALNYKRLNTGTVPTYVFSLQYFLYTWVFSMLICSKETNERLNLP